MKTITVCAGPGLVVCDKINNGEPNPNAFRVYLTNPFSPINRIVACCKPMHPYDLVAEIKAILTNFKEHDELANFNDIEIRTNDIFVIRAVEVYAKLFGISVYFLWYENDTDVEYTVKELGHDSSKVYESFSNVFKILDSEESE